MGVLVLGSLNIDLVAYLDRMPNSGETLPGKDLKTFPGGKGLNQAVAASRAGTETVMAGAVGNDPGAQLLRDLMASENIACGSVVTKNLPTGTAIIEVDDSGENRIIVFAGANGKLDSADILDTLLSSVSEPRIILSQLEIPMQTVEQVFFRAKAVGFLTILNPAPASKIEASLLSAVDILIPNKHEASLLSGIEIVDLVTATTAGYKLLELGANSVIITLGAQGALLVERNETYYQKPFSIQPVDTTAAGDAFCGALAASMSRGNSAKDSLEFACVAGALATTKLGATPSLPTKAEICSVMQR